LLKPEDSEPLLALLTDTTLEPGLRNRAGSLLFGRQLRNNRAEFNRVADAVRRYYYENADSDAWQVLRAVALAVADQTDDGRLILDWLDRIRTSEGFVQVNLSMTDTYYNGTHLAIETYLRRIRDFFRNRPCGRLWEVFYIGRRAVPRDEDVLAMLNECRDHSENTHLRALCDESITLLNGTSGSLSA
jgi:hypothetical protein